MSIILVMPSLPILKVMDICLSCNAYLLSCYVYKITSIGPLIKIKNCTVFAFIISCIILHS